MENFEDYINSNENSKAKGLDKAFENTYKLVTGKISLDKIANNFGRDIFLLYDPTDISEKELKVVLLDIIDHYIESEEYEKCQEIKEILDSKKLKPLIKKITIADNTEKTISNINDLGVTGTNSIDQLISLFKRYRDNFEKDTSGVWPKSKHEKKYIPHNDYLTDVEMWSLMTDNDRSIFENDYKLFKNWTAGLDSQNKIYYSERLIEEKPLIPIVQEEMYNEKGNYDYNSIVVSIVGDYICISNYSSEKIEKIQEIITKLGITESEIRIKTEDGQKPVYTLVYSSKLPPINPNKE